MKHAITIAAIASLMATGATADRMNVLIGSRHVGVAPGTYNEVNPGLFYTFENDTIDMTVGFYENSYSDTSVAVMASYDFWEWDGGAAAVFGGVAHYPYDKNPFGEFVPLAGLQVRHGNVFAQFIPMDGKPVNALIAAGFTFDMQ